VRDIVVTVTAKLWLNWLCEGDLPGDPILESGTWEFATSRPPKEWKPGQRVYVVAHGYLRGYGELLHAADNYLTRFGPGVACTVLDQDTPKPIRGFQGWRYATWRRDEVAEWGGEDKWATFGLPPKLTADVAGVLALRRRSPRVREILREASLRSGVWSLADAQALVRGRG
jgi:hypothetical protein